MGRFKPKLTKPSKQENPRSFRIPAELLKDLESMAKENDLKLNGLVVQALTHIVQEWKDKGKKRK